MKDKFALIKAKEWPGSENVSKEGPYRRTWRLLRSDPVALISMVVIALLLIMAIFAPWVAPYSPNEIVAQPLQKSSGAHWLGTDESGRDILSRLIYGARISMSVAIGAQILVSFIGFWMGLLAGYMGGWVDRVVSFIIQVFASFPYLLFAMALMFAMGSGIINLFLAIGLLSWASTARVIRTQVMSLKHREFVDASWMMGASHYWIMTKHLLPNVLPSIIVLATMGIPGAIMAEATLSYLGLGVQIPTASWGQMIQAAQPNIRTFPQYSLATGFIMVISVLAFNLFGDRLRDALDPRLGSR
ncbi:ABC transporter permease [Entomospira culicis]|uniref:ABC transporter permease n=1 Tax=Entomospira culicis TaxID=2719989 RepID=A0A968KXA5_9SPIO|nr:ABC transporter permease [Entomospira culicis]NIZ19896.1 ABC transporter permease [Entomospira culicis]NIZ70147.1 ABC transporter permease [Entomospira culicis]WDI38074.1 ABC transporter permease [Entomospira culicis]WDI39697.1 ABC transporter permease [Entomospira culicis]